MKKLVVVVVVVVVVAAAAAIRRERRSVGFPPLSDSRRQWIAFFKYEKGWLWTK